MCSPNWASGKGISNNYAGCSNGEGEEEGFYSLWLLCSGVHKYDQSSHCRALWDRYRCHSVYTCTASTLVGWLWLSAVQGGVFTVLPWWVTYVGRRKIVSIGWRKATYINVTLWDGSGITQTSSTETCASVFQKGESLFSHCLNSFTVNGSYSLCYKSNCLIWVLMSFMPL